MPRPRRRVVIVTFPQGQLLDVAGPLQAFATANTVAGEPVYDLHVVSRGGGAVTTSSGLALVTESLAALGRAAIDTLIVAGGSPGIGEAVKDKALVRWVARQGKMARRTCSVCTGAFLLAATGLLDGRRATTHWGSIDWLRDNHPPVDVRADERVVDEGAIVTSAGVSAGIDMALHVVARLHGEAAAAATARNMEYDWRRQ